MPDDEKASLSKVAVDLSTEEEQEISSEKLLPHKESWHPEKARMQLAYRVLYGIFIVFLLSIGMNILAFCGWFDKTMNQSLFELCKTSLLPIVTLILGFYFSKNG